MHFFCKAPKGNAECGAKLDASDADCKVCKSAPNAVVAPAPEPSLPVIAPDSSASSESELETAIESPIAKKKHK